MRTLITAFALSTLVACGGGSSSTTGGNTPPAPPAPTPMPRVTLQAPRTAALAPAVAPIGSPTPTMIVTDQGQFIYESAAFQQAKGSFLVDAQGNATLVSGATLTQPDGTTGEFTFTGTYINGVLNGTSNAGGVNLVNTNLQGTPVDLTAASGDYASLASSTGLLTYIHLNADGSFYGEDYVDLAHYPQFGAGLWSGSLKGNSSVPNALAVSAQYTASGESSPRPYVFGYAMFDATGKLYIFAANTGGSPGDMQFSDVFAKQ